MTFKFLCNALAFSILFLVVSLSFLAKPVAAAECNCTDWVAKSCGGGHICTADRMYKTRSCPTTCGTQIKVEGCFLDPACVTPVTTLTPVPTRIPTPTVKPLPSPTIEPLVTPTTKPTSTSQTLPTFGQLQIGWSSMCWVNDRAYWTVRVDNTSSSAFTAPSLGIVDFQFPMSGLGWDYPAPQTLATGKGMTMTNVSFGPQNIANGSDKVYIRSNMYYLCQPSSPMWPNCTSYVTYPNAALRYGFSIGAELNNSMPDSYYMGTNGPIIKHCDCSIIAPTAVTVTASSRGLQLTWQDNSDETSYRVERSITGLSQYQVIADRLPANTRLYVDTTAKVGNTYSYRVTALTDKLDWRSCTSKTSNLIRF